MSHTCTLDLLTEAARSVYLLKIDDFISGTAAMTMKMRKKYRTNKMNKYGTSLIYVKSKCNVDGYQWETRFYPAYTSNGEAWVALDLVFLDQAGMNSVRATLSCRLVDPTGNLGPSEETFSESRTFQSALGFSKPVLVMRKREVEASGYLDKDSLTVECTITVFKDLKAIPLPVCDLAQHLGELLQSQAAGADVTFVVSGKSFSVHKSILAARSPVFMAMFFGDIEKKSSQIVGIRDMDPEAFQAMLQFIYTGRVPELDEKEEAATVLAQHLISAADRYMMDRLKVMCEHRLAFGIDVNTAAKTLALAEQHRCLQLKAKCIEFIAGGSPENLKAVLATEGYKYLETCSPSVVTELLMASHARKN